MSAVTGNDASQVPPSDIYSQDLPVLALKDLENPDTIEDADGGSERSDEGDDDCSSVLSETSTIEYEQESFDTFQIKARDLVLQLWPDLCPGDVKVNQMKGGGYNRVLGITILEIPPIFAKSPLKFFRTIFTNCFGLRRRSANKYILRIPRSEPSGMVYNAATLEYAARNVSFAVPKIVTYDMSDTNALAQAYMLQERLPGEPLVNLWKSLNFEQKKSAVRSISEIVLQLHSVKNKSAGIVSKNNSTLDMIEDVKLEQMPVPRGFAYVGTHGAETLPAMPQTTREFLISLCDRQHKRAKETGEPTFDKVWRSFVNIVNKMHDLGLLPDHDCFHLFHGDLQSRNLLAKVLNGSSIAITGILDWDSSVFAPRFMSTRAPFFLWSDEDAHEEEEEDAVLTPSDPEKVKFKRVFEDCVGADYYCDSYRMEYVLARRMFYLLTRGIASGNDVFFAQEIIERFEKLHSGSIKDELHIPPFS